MATACLAACTDSSSSAVSPVRSYIRWSTPLRAERAPALSGPVSRAHADGLPGGAHRLGEGGRVARLVEQLPQRGREVGQVAGEGRVAGVQSGYGLPPDVRRLLGGGRAARRGRQLPQRVPQVGQVRGTV